MVKYHNAKLWRPIVLIYMQQGSSSMNPKHSKLKVKMNS